MVYHQIQEEVVPFKGCKQGFSSFLYDSNFIYGALTLNPAILKRESLQLAIVHFKCVSEVLRPLAPYFIL